MLCCIIFIILFSMSIIISSYPMGTGGFSFPGLKLAGVKVTTYLHLIPASKNRGSIHSLPIHLHSMVLNWLNRGTILTLCQHELCRLVLDVRTSRRVSVFQLSSGVVHVPETCKSYVRNISIHRLCWCIENNNKNIIFMLNKKTTLASQWVNIYKSTVFPLFN
jgi:hypothetical protein